MPIQDVVIKRVKMWLDEKVIALEVFCETSDFAQQMTLIGQPLISKLMKICKVQSLDGLPQRIISIDCEQTYIRAFSSKGKSDWISTENESKQSTTDLWGELDLKSVKNSYTISKIQAGFLTKNTKGILKGELVRHLYDNGTEIKNSEMKWGFYIIATCLHDYRFLVFDLYQNLSEGDYPVNVVLESSIAEELDLAITKSIVVVSERAFIELLTKIFHSERLCNIISILMAQST